MKDSENTIYILMYFGAVVAVSRNFDKIFDEAFKCMKESLSKNKKDIHELCHLYNRRRWRDMQRYFTNNSRRGHFGFKIIKTELENFKFGEEIW